MSASIPRIPYTYLPATGVTPDLTDHRTAHASVMQDVDDTLALTTKVINTVFNPIVYGATGDGTLHQLSSLYATLAAAQAVYPFVTSLTQSVDWAAIQLAVNNAQAFANGIGAGGGVVQIPPGVFVMSDQLSLPEGVMLSGSGMQATILSWPTDLGAGKWAILRSDVINQLQLGPWLRDLQVRGPGNPTVTVSATPAVNMDGIRAVAIQERVWVTGFRCGFTVIHSHEQFIHCLSTANWVNLYYESMTVIEFGNQAYYACDFSYAQWASLLCEGSNMLNGVGMYDCYMGKAPFAMIKRDDGLGNALANPFIISCRFWNTGFEGVGNSCIRDESTVSNSLVGWQWNTFEGCEWSLNYVTYGTAARPHDYTFVLRNIAGRNSFHCGLNIGRAAVGTVQALDATNGTFEWWEGNIGLATIPSTFVFSAGDSNVIYHPHLATGCEYGSTTVAASSTSPATVTITTALWVGPLNSLYPIVELEDNSVWTPTSHYVQTRLISSTPGDGYTRFTVFVFFAPSPVPVGQSFTVRWRLR